MELSALKPVIAKKNLSVLNFFVVLSALAYTLAFFNSWCFSNFIFLRENNDLADVPFLGNEIRNILFFIPFASCYLLPYLAYLLRFRFSLIQNKWLATGMCIINLVSIFLSQFILVNAIAADKNPFVFFTDLSALAWDYFIYYAFEVFFTGDQGFFWIYSIFCYLLPMLITILYYKLAQDD